MINIRREQQVQCKINPRVLCEVLEVELEKVRDKLEIATEDKSKYFQGEAQALRSVIKLLK